MQIRLQPRARSACVVACGCATIALLAAPASARQLMEQVMPDGSVVITDRPVSGGRTTRTWQLPDAPSPQEEALAQQRREAAQREAAAVSARIQGALDRQQALDTQRDIAAMRAQQALAERELDMARMQPWQTDPDISWPFATANGWGWQQPWWRQQRFGPQPFNPPFDGQHPRHHERPAGLRPLPR